MSACDPFEPEAAVGYSVDRVARPHRSLTGEPAHRALRVSGVGKTSLLMAKVIPLPERNP
jgi:hypothetical protein